MKENKRRGYGGEMTNLKLQWNKPKKEGKIFTKKDKLIIATMLSMAFILYMYIGPILVDLLD